MNLKFQTDKMYMMQDAFNALRPDSLTMNHFQLAEQTEFDADDWYEFLKDGAVAKAIKSEMDIIVRTNQNKLVASATDNDRSVGAAQMLNAMTKLDGEDKAEEHFYIYSYVPLTPNEEHADHVRQENDWIPPTIIQEEVKTEKQQELEEFCDTKIETVIEEEKKVEVDEDDWF